MKAFRHKEGSKINIIQYLYSLTKTNTYEQYKRDADRKKPSEGICR